MALIDVEEIVATFSKPHQNDVVERAIEKGDDGIIIRVSAHDDSIVGYGAVCACVCVFLFEVSSNGLHSHRLTFVDRQKPSVMPCQWN